MTADYQGLTPPPELVEEWLRERPPGELAHAFLATQAARWGADQELKACCEWLRSKDILEPAIDALRNHRRPKPSSLAEEALEAFMQLPLKVWGERDTGPVLLKIRRALVRLQELKGGND